MIGKVFPFPFFFDDLNGAHSDLKRIIFESIRRFDF